MAKIEGGCLCGAIRYHSDAEPVLTAVCHCTHCQKQTGTTFSIVVGVPGDALTVEGTMKVFVDDADSGGKVRRNFCPDCGSPIYSDTDGFPGVLFLKAGTLDDTSWLKPTAQVWTRSKQPWIDLGPGMASSPDGSRPR
ncbi:MAG: GFA family protein [Hyphomicrobiales bacterium]|nr:GFA family protein [Hyphomicrobiales bacterium]MCP5374212.1 GFA family protein [Hyphomicrobiales bacterium]